MTHSLKNCLFFIFFACAFFNSLAAAQSHYVLVSVAPYKCFVEKIAGDTVKVGLMVPAGASAHTYEPTPKEMMAASTADLWFLIGESFEARAVEAIQSHHPSIQLVDLRQNVDLISADPNHRHEGCCHKNCQDLHIWLSPKQAQIQAKAIAEALGHVYPANHALYQENLKKLIAELQTLDHQISHQLQALDNRTILVAHPAYGYFCRDYQLRQISIEFEGKDPTPRQLTKVLEDARQNQIKKVFIQKQYSNKGARLIASTLNASVINLDPYSENYFSSMLEIAQQISKK
jgi:zinc transport system substrate-binding protein